MEEYLRLAAIAVVSYLLGSFNAAITISNHYAKKDIREYGSGNAGTANMLRTFGPVMGTMTFLIDVLKGSLATFLGMLPGILTGNDSLRLMGGMLGGLMAVVGHNWPIYYRFRGGKGVATTAGSFLVMNPILGLIVLAVSIGSIFFTKYISVASLCGTFAFAVALVVTNIGSPVFGYYLLYAVIAWLMVLFAHRENLKRLAAGNEKKVDLVQVFTEKKRDFQQKRADKKDK